MKKKFLVLAIISIALLSQAQKVKVYSTAENTNMKLSLVDSAEFKEMKQPFETQICVFVNPNKTFQSFIGIGGAVTDATAETFAKLPANKQDELLEKYYSKEKGIGYTIARTNINSCDFSSDMYTYVKDNDKLLTTFSIEHDLKFKVPFIKRAMLTSKGALKLYASPWSPPAWMKDNNTMLQGGKLLPQYYQTWANYYPKFIKAYETVGVPVWGISVQNEPMAKQRWESCIYTAEEERDFVKNYLGPTMHKAGLQSKKIIVWDHNRDLLYQRAQTYFSDAAMSKYVWGIGFHWYENWSGGQPMFDNVRKVYEAYPNKNLFFTEGCKEAFSMEKVTDWQLGEKYATNMINDFNNGTVGYTDWNILLDENGGPNHVGNFCFAPVHANTKTGELIYTNAYYYIGHFSKFINVGAKRISSVASRSQILTTAFKNADGKNVVVVMNLSADATIYYLWVNGKAAELKAQPHSISTLIF